MKKYYSAFWWTVLAFGLVNGYDVLSQFGWVTVDRSPLVSFAVNFGVAVRNFIGYTLLPASLVFILRRNSRWFLVSLFALVLGVESACEFSSKVFHAGLNDNWIALVTNTSLEEIIGFAAMTMSVWTVVGVLLFVLCVAGYAAVLRKASYPERSWLSRAIGIGLLCPFVVMNMLLINWHSGISQTIWSSFGVSSYLSWKNMQGVIRACDHPNLPAKIDTLVPIAELPDVVIVIGESSTRNNWSLYGYSRSTTPRLNDLCRGDGNGVALRNVVGIQPITVGALSVLLTDSVHEDKQRGSWTLAEVYHRAGYRCVQISNQLNGEGDRSLLARLFNGCEKRICPRSRLPPERKYDEYMMPFITEELQCRKDRPLALFVHLTGMHFPVQDVNPPADNYFTDAIEADALEGLSEHDRDRRNRYDNGVRYEDKVLGMIVDALKETERAAMMFYITDHGESPRSSIWRNYEDVDVYELPCIIWFSDEYIRRFPTLNQNVKSVVDRPLQPDQMTTGLLDLGLVRREGLFDTSFLDEDFHGRSPRLMDKGRMVYESVKGIR